MKRFNAGHLIRCLNVLEGARFGLEHRGPTAEVQSHRHRIILRGDLTDLGKHLLDLDLKLSLASLLKLLTILFDDSKPYDFVTVDQHVHEFRTILAAELEGMQFVKCELSVIDGGAKATA